MTPKQREILASYLTLPRRVGLHSIGLSSSRNIQSDAEDFFELRTAFGVNGYDDYNTALEKLSK